MALQPGDFTNAKRLHVAASWCLVLCLAEAQLAWCGDNERYELLYASAFSPHIFVEQMRRAYDVNGDGYDDILVRYSEDWAKHVPPTAAILSGMDGTPLWSYQAHCSNPGCGGGEFDIADVDGDGSKEVILAWSNVPSPSGLGHGLIEVRALDKHVIWSRYAEDGEAGLGYHLVTVGDINGDGGTDIAAYSGLLGLIRVTIISGLDGSTLYKYENAAFEFGMTKGVGDVDGDGVPDFAISAYDWRLAGGLFVHSGRTGQELFRVAFADEQIGFGIVGPGDLNADGHADIVLDSMIRTIAVSGRDGTILWTYDHQVFDKEIAHDIAAISDDTGDGIPEVIVDGHTAGFDKGVAFELSGADGTLVEITSDDDPNAHGFGLRPVALGDINGDGLEDWGVWEQYRPPGWKGDVRRVWTVVRKSLRANATTALGQAEVELIMPALPGHLFVVLGSMGSDDGVVFGTRTIPLNDDPLLWQFIAHPIFGRLDASGSAALHLPIPFDTVEPLMCAALVFDPSAPLQVRTISNALALPRRR